MILQSRPATDRWSGLFCAGAAGVVVGYAAALSLLFVQHNWVLAASGRAIPGDFLAYWAAGKAALAHRAATAYDPNAFHVFQTSIAGHFSSYLYWSYPPVFLFVAVLLASLSYGAAYISWIAATAAAYALTTVFIVHRRAAGVFALASPAAFLTIYTGQNGFLTAALFGGFLVTLPYRPIISGILLGLMTYKPQFGLLLPIALAASGQWRCICSAAVSAVLLLILSILVFGAGTIAEFLHGLPTASNAVLTLGGEGWQKVESAYGVARFLGTGDRMAWLMQIGLILVCATLVTLLWKGKTAWPVKAAGLITAAMLSTPYVNGYDFPVLMMALAFLYRDKPFDTVEWTMAIAANLVIAGLILQLAPIGPIAILLVGAMTVRRLLANSAAAVQGPAAVAALTG